MIFGPHFPGAAPLLTLLFAAGVGFSVTSVAVAIITAADRPTIVSMLGVGILGAAIIGHLVLIPRLGALGAATVTAVTGASGAALAIGIVHSVWRVHAYDTLCRAAVVAAPSYWAAATIATPTPLGVVVKLTLLSVAAVAAFIALGELHADDKVRLRQPSRRASWRGDRSPRSGQEGARSKTEFRDRQTCARTCGTRARLICCKLPSTPDGSSIESRDPCEFGRGAGGPLMQRQRVVIAGGAAAAISALGYRAWDRGGVYWCDRFGIHAVGRVARQRSRRKSKTASRSDPRRQPAQHAAMAVRSVW